MRFIQRSFKRYGFQTLLLLLVVYFFYHLVQGGRGLMSLNVLEDALENAVQKREQLQAQHEHLEHKVSLMAPGHVDADLLEEVAKKNLGVARPEEQVVVIRDKSDLR